MIPVSPDADRAPILHSEEQSAADRAVTASGRDPPVRDFLRRSVTVLRIVSVGILLGENIQAQLSQEVHAASSGVAR